MIAYDDSSGSETALRRLRRAGFPQEAEALVVSVANVWNYEAVEAASSVLTIYEMERARSGSHSVAACRLGMRRNTLTDWLAWARLHAAKSTKELPTTPKR